MLWFRDLNIGKKLFIGFGITVVLTILVGVIAILGLKEIETMDTKMYERDVCGIQYIGEVYGTFQRLRANVLNAVLQKDKNEKAKFVKRSSELSQEVEENLKKYEKLADDNDKKRYESFLKAWSEYKVTVASVLSLAELGKTEEALALIEKHRETIDSASTIIVEMMHKNSEQAKQVSDNNTKTADAVIRNTFLLILAAMSVAILSAVFVTRGITRPLAVISKELDDLASRGGDLTQKINISSKDEIGHLAESVNYFLENMRQIMIKVVKGSESVAAAAQEMTASAEQTAQASNQVVNSVSEMAEGTETQSQAVIDVSATMEQMSAGIEETAATVNGVAGTMENTMQMSQTGRTVLKEASTQMNNIAFSAQEVSASINKLKERSEEINSVVDTILSIAGQTNLLALNAAIEAARAGEHGRGFSVVADEVRKLAEQSQESAKGITDIVLAIRKDTEEAVLMMMNGSQDVVKGMEVVNKAESVFADIAEVVERASAEMADISATVEEIASGSQHIVGKAEEVTLITKNNAEQVHTISAATEEQLAANEEMAKSSEGLSRLAIELQEIVGRFKL